MNLIILTVITQTNIMQKRSVKLRFAITYLTVQSVKVTHFYFIQSSISPEQFLHLVVYGQPVRHHDVLSHNTFRVSS